MSKKTGLSVREEARQTAAKVGKGAGTTSTFAKIVVFAASLVVIAAVVIIALSVRNQPPVADNGSVPAGGNADGGITLVNIGQLAEKSSDVVDVTQLPAVPEIEGTASPSGVKVAKAGEKVQVLIYQDPNCSHCNAFEETYGPTISEWMAAGEIELEHRNVGFLDANSTTNFSSRAANAQACVANDNPAAYLPFSTALYAHQPEGELSNAQLTSLAVEHGAPDAAECIDKGKFRAFVKYTTTAAQVAQIPGTPSVFVNGKQWDGTEAADFNLWARSIIEADKK